MESRGRCESCGEDAMILDDDGGILVCGSCGRMGNQAETELRAEFQSGHVMERGGTFVGVNDTGVGAARGLARGQFFVNDSRPWNERYRADTMKEVDRITALLRVPGDKIGQVKHLLESTLNDDWGTGRWVEILVAACVYIVIRQSQLPLTITEVADCVNCDLVELGRMYKRILEKLETKPPKVDTHIYLERAASTLPALTKQSKEVIRKIISQSTVLLKYAEEWSITTGRRSLPVVAAVLSIVMEANEVNVEIAEVASELHAGLTTAKKRYKECKKALVGIAQRLPWGKDLTLKTVLRHFPFLIKYLELKMKIDEKEKGRVPSDSPLWSTAERVSCAGADSLDCKQPVSLVPQRLVSSRESKSTHLGGNQGDSTSAKDLPPPPSTQPSGIALPGAQECHTTVVDSSGARRPPVSSTDVPKRKASCIGVYVPFLESKRGKSLRAMVDYNVSERGSGSDDSRLSGNEDTSTDVNPSCTSGMKGQTEGVSQIVEMTIKSQDSIGRSHLRMTLEEDLRWRLPVSFVASVEARKRRRVKIDLAKKRILEASKALVNRFGKTCSFISSGSVQSVQKELHPNGQCVNDLGPINLDWEDLIIEHLVLCGANEIELENGYYLALLSHYPFKDDSSFTNEEDLDECVRSKNEVDWLEKHAPY